MPTPMLPYDPSNPFHYFTPSEESDNGEEDKERYDYLYGGGPKPQSEEERKEAERHAYLYLGGPKPQSEEETQRLKDLYGLTPEEEISPVAKTQAFAWAKSGKWLNVSSSAISAIAYDWNNEELYVAFIRTGRTGKYKSVDHATAMSFYNAGAGGGSYGKFWHARWNRVTPEYV